MISTSRGERQWRAVEAKTSGKVRGALQSINLVGAPWFPWPGYDKKNEPPPDNPLPFMGL